MRFQVIRLTTGCGKYFFPFHLPITFKILDGFSKFFLYSNQGKFEFFFISKNQIIFIDFMTLLIECKEKQKQKKTGNNNQFP